MTDKDKTPPSDKARPDREAHESEMEDELCEGLRETFPASDAPSATRPGAEEEDAAEERGGR